LERLTFLLAVVGYAGLTTTAVLSAYGRFPARIWRAAAVAILVHVVLVWVVRYEGQLAQAIRNGYAGFLLFHAALILVAVSLTVPERHARQLVWIAFAIVTPGAIGAVFRYEAVTGYRNIVVAIAAVGVFGLGRSRWFGRRQSVGVRSDE
jgi:hypothetical protein